MTNWGKRMLWLPRIALLTTLLLVAAMLAGLQIFDGFTW
jgi:hypothetical protein